MVIAVQTVDAQQQVLGAVNEQLQEAQDEHKTLLREHVQVGWNSKLCKTGFSIVLLFASVQKKP